MYEYKATVVSVYDGDTITVDIDLGFGIVMHQQKLRLYGIDTPEVRGEERPAGLVAKEALLERMGGDNCVIYIRTFKDKKGSFGRWLAELFLNQEDMANNLSINQWLIDNGYAEVYAR